MAPSIELLLSDRSLERNRELFLGLDGELHRKLLEDFLRVAVDDKANGLFGGDATLVAVEAHTGHPDAAHFDCTVHSSFSAKIRKK